MNNVEVRSTHFRPNIPRKVTHAILGFLGALLGFWLQFFSVGIVCCRVTEWQSKCSRGLIVNTSVLRHLKGGHKKTPLSKFHVQFSYEPLVPGGCPSQDLMY